jgi:hypothetical protein
MANSLTGGCVCGSVRYECAAEPVMTGNCHCRDCQKAGGGAFAPALAVPAAALKIQGEVKYYDTKGDSGHMVSRGFCPNCGARLFGKSKSMPDLVIVLAGSLDDPSSYRPGMDIYTASAQPWDFMNPELKKFSRMPTL